MIISVFDIVENILGKKFAFTSNFSFFHDVFKEFADDNFKLDENDRKFYRRVENTVGKGKIARYEQFLLFQQCFKKSCTADT